MDESGRRGTTRRTFLIGGAAVGGAAVGGAALGVGLEFGTHSQPVRPKRPSAPPALVAAADAERALLADLDATTGGAPAVRDVIRQIRADHAAHLQALAGLAATYPGFAPARASGTTNSAAGQARTKAQLRDAEQAASDEAARRAGVLVGAAAALLASIAACEATHAELLA